MKIGKLFSWALWGGIAVLILYFLYASIMQQVALRKYGTLFTQVMHPPGTALVDSLSFSFSIYPATYIDENIDFVPVYLVGELRKYTGSWDDVKLFYNPGLQLENGNQVVVLPLVIDQREQSSWLEIKDGVSYDPSNAAVIEELKDYYGLHGIPNKLNGTEQKVYLVYSLWWGPDEESAR